MIVGHARVENANHAVRFDPPSSLAPFVAEGCVFGSVDFTKVDNCFSDTGDLLVGRGRIELADDDQTVNAAEARLIFNSLTSKAMTWELKDTRFRNTRTYGAFSSRIELINTAAAATGRHTLILDNFIDESDEDKALHLPRVAGLHPVHLILRNGTFVRDLQPRVVAVWPAELTVEPGVTCSFAGRDFATLVADLDSAGVVHNLGSLSAGDITLLPGRSK